MADSNRVGVEIWEMGSAPGYRPSYGWQRVYLVRPDDITGNACTDPEALYYLVQGEDFEIVREIEPEDLIDPEPVFWQTGVLTYSGTSGILEVPEGLVAVQVTYESICTHDESTHQARVLNQESLLALYEERAEAYSALATSVRDFLKKKASFADLRKAASAA